MAARGNGTPPQASVPWTFTTRLSASMTMSPSRICNSRQGALFGNGSVTGNVVNVGGVVSPGNSYGILTITGNYTQGPDGVLEIELDATTAPNAGVNYDQLVIVGGTAVFEDGTTVRVRPTFGPTLPDRAEYVLVHGDVVFDVDTINLELELPRRLFYGGWLEEGSMKLILGITDFDAVAETENQKQSRRPSRRLKSRRRPISMTSTTGWWALTRIKRMKPRDAYDSLAGEVYSHLPT